MKCTKAGPWVLVAYSSVPKIRPAWALEEREEHDFGKFGWFVDPDGNRVELWAPPEQA